MEELERKIKEAAYEFSKPLDSNNDMMESSYIAGAKSPEAREYWLQKLTEEFESESDDSYISVIEIISKVIKSDLAKEHWQEGMFTIEQVKELVGNAYEKGKEDGLNEETTSILTLYGLVEIKPDKKKS